MAQLAQSAERNTSNHLSLAQDLTQKTQDLANATQLEEAAKLALTTLKDKIPAQELAFRTAAQTAQKSQQALTESKQQIQLEQNNINYLSQNIDENNKRIQGLETNLAQLVLPDESALSINQALLAQAQKNIAQLEQAVQKLQADESALQVEINALREQQNQAQRLSNQAEAEISSLQKIQQSLNTEGKLGDWLSSRGLKNNARLWQKVNIDETWSVALEAVLGTKLNALISSDALSFEDRPPSSLVLGYRAANTNHEAPQNTQLTPLINVVKDCDTDLKPILNDWLAGAYLLGVGDNVSSAVAQLKLGETLVSLQGDIYSRHSVSYHGENSSLHGVLERQQQLDKLQQNLPKLQESLHKFSEALTTSEASLHAVRQQQQYENNQLKTASSLQYQQQLELSRLQHAQQVAIERETSIKADIAAAKTRILEQVASKTNKEQALQAVLAKMPLLEITKDNDLLAQQQAEKAFAELRDAAQAAEVKYQESHFNLQILNNNINELNNKIKVTSEEKSTFLVRQKDIEATLTLTPMETLKSNLTEAINTKQLRQVALAEARNHLTGQEAQLQALERTRMQNEQQLHPMRDNVEQSRLKEQESRLYFEQCQVGLLENGQNETDLAKDLAENAKTSDLLRKTIQLQQDIGELGAVNLAAIQELVSETERKSYLDSQMLDLSEATETLEDAIKKIDRETRDKLMHTFNTANQHFGELFATLFGGGQAKLELLGDEILDTGLQVFAQPPGKKNTTIQLLSGGEKALTALALVFALFRLNPAPFCLMDEVDAPLDDSNTERFCAMVKKMSEKTQFLFVSHNKITMEMAQQLIGVTMQESGVSRIVDVDIEAALELQA